MENKLINFKYLGLPAVLLFLSLFIGCASTVQKDTESQGGVSYIDDSSSDEIKRKAKEEAEEIRRKNEEQQAQIDAARAKAAQEEADEASRREAEEARRAAEANSGAESADDYGFLPSERSLYFDYDKFIVRVEYENLIRKHFEYLSTNTEINLRLEGNCDNRGGTEYNLALGNSRAQAVKDALTALGISSNRIEAISFGKEKLVAFGEDESSHQLNRRVDIVYK